VVAVLNLALVLFLDAIKLRFDGPRNEWMVPVLALGPGSILIMALVALSAWLLLRVPPLEAMMIGAILASTDPIVLRDLLRDRRIPQSIRQALAVEGGTNDLVVLPTLLVLIAIAVGRVGGGGAWAWFLFSLFVIGPAIGFAVGGIGAWLVARADQRYQVRREYQTLYGIGIVFVAYSVAQFAGGDGFLAAFAAGVAVTVLNLELCDCFYEYGEATAEMAMLFAFVMFGAVLSQLILTVPLGATLALAGLVLVVIRPSVIGLVLWRADVSRSARAFIGWFGPRGLNSLLLALLCLRAGVPYAEHILAIVGTVVTVSVIVHGISVTPLSTWYAKRVLRETLPEEREPTAAGLFGEDAEVPKISIDELAQLLAGDTPPIVLDVRSRSDLNKEPARIPASVRVQPDEIKAWAEREHPARPVVTYCG
ncbi:MAG: cation:proton antiporter, partial [Candidatus Binataceae bacterium]